MRGEGRGVAQGLQLPKELEPAVGIGLLERFQEETAEQPAQYAHRQKEPWAAGDPFPVGRESAAGDHAVQVGMQVQVLAPGVEDGEETDFGAQMLGIAGNREEGFGGGAGEDIVATFLVWKAMAASGSGMVKTTWKYSTGNNSAVRRW